MKSILKKVKKTEQGDKLCYSKEVLIPDEEGNISDILEITAFKCPSCGTLHEENLIREKCPTSICRGPCCPKCCEERKQERKYKIEQHIMIEKEQLRWVAESPRLFGDSWIMTLLRKVQWYNSVSRLNTLHYCLEEINAKILSWKDSRK